MDIEFLMLTGAAEAVGNKVYLISGGWNEFRSAQFPVQLPFYVVFSLIGDVGVAEGQEAPATLSILGPTGPVIPDIQATLRRPGGSALQPHRAITATQVNLNIAGTGLYTVTLRVGNLEKKASFEVNLVNPSA